MIQLPGAVTEKGFPGGSVSEEYACNAGDLGSIPGLGRSLGGGHGNPLQYSSLENPMDRGAWWATVHDITDGMTEQLSTHVTENAFISIFLTYVFLNTLFLRNLVISMGMNYL